MSAKILAVAILIFLAVGLVQGVADRSALAQSDESPAVAPGQLNRQLTSRTISGVNTCQGLGESITINLGARPKPVVVTWSADYASSDRWAMTLKINGGPCAALGPAQLRTFPGPGFELANMQWIVFPSDGLVPGNNTFELAGNALISGASILLGFRTLAGRKAN